MAITLPAYVAASTLDTTWDSDGTTALAPLLAGGAADVITNRLTRGLLTGIRFTYYDGATTASNLVVVTLYKGSGTTLDGGTDEVLATISLTFSGEGASLTWVPVADNGGGVVPVAIPFDQAPYIHCNPGVDTSKILITPYVRSIAG